MKTKILVGVAMAVFAVLSLTVGALAQGPQPGWDWRVQPPIAGAPLDTQTQQALIDALNDEYHAHAFYQAVIDKFGQVAPFTNILRAESAHIAAVQSLMTRYGLAIPADSYIGQVQAPATLNDALQAAVDAEKANVALYDRFAFITQPDIQAVFAQLRNVSQTRHLPAFENALNAGTGTTPQYQFFGRRWTR